MKRKGFSCSFQLILKGSGFSFGWISDAGIVAGGSWGVGSEQGSC